MAASALGQVWSDYPRPKLAAVAPGHAVDGVQRAVPPDFVVAASAVRGSGTSTLINLESLIVEVADGRGSRGTNGTQVECS